MLAATAELEGEIEQLAEHLADIELVLVPLHATHDPFRELDQDVAVEMTRSTAQSQRSSLFHQPAEEAVVGARCDPMYLLWGECSSIGKV